ncbi:nickel-dependent hydrogenase large subunit [Caloramator sp. mosi_1]|nr:nickel-dependent hydrogenase large subunit [Caloramator sp. mosi_1]WDC85269.1 nickel-dependent hydrogenase large subunit [Caloramator sp. mosi_1]
MSSTIKLDPITRLEGHMKIEVEIENNKVVQAKCTGNMFRGFESLLKGRDPRDAVHITQRICGLCPVSHAVASSLAIENSVGYRIGNQARLLRNLIQGGNYLADHILHFYHLSLLDYVKGPDKSLWATTYETDLRLSRKYNKQIFNNYIKALDIRRKAHQMVTIFSGKVPHRNVYYAWGVTKEPTREEINEYKSLLNEIKTLLIMNIIMIFKLLHLFIKIILILEKAMAILSHMEFFLLKI